MLEKNCIWQVEKIPINNIVFYSKSPVFYDRALGISLFKFLNVVQYTYSNNLAKRISAIQTNSRAVSTACSLIISHRRQNGVK